MSVNELFQYSVVSALMDGVASKGLPISTLLANGNHGLGTFRHMVGEMIILDGKVYQMNSDGSVATVSPSSSTSPDDDRAVTPFAMVTRFSPTVTTRAAFQSKQHLFDSVSSLLPGTRNNYISIRLDGTFKNVKARTVGGQAHPREGLAELGKHQTTREFAGDEGIRGTVIGFRSPAFMQGISVAGDHLHFISEDRKTGGHLLSFETVGEVEVKVAGIWKVVLELPRDDEEFDQAKLEADREGIEKAEG
ncbi:alpha-acetolactate decarboxylase [Coniochaeta ligniaria NRRL 30616]|uniref:Alpha-acetolactate decarboxylase n=1 Tax=Coniochaeta ligniaria NRRL 30616 TaxID=1408157 RepID=A0A1J7I8T6_9PEZI|nr:alpha-acetolactate decarboxylase [Coniochaeta ligniaria NRRL 30616]